MKDRGSGPEEPDRRDESFEIEAPDATLDHDKCGCDGVQPCLIELFSQYGDVFEGVDPDQVVYDSGWQGSSNMAVGVVFTEGPVDRHLWNWARDQMFRGALAASEGTVEDQ